MNRIARLALASSFFLAACGGSTGSVGDGSPTPGEGTAAPGTSSGGSASGEELPGTITAKPGPGAQVTLALRGSTAAVPHADGFASQTPKSQNVAVKSFWLLKSANDPAPLKVADLGTNAVETDLVSGKTNDITTVSLKSMPAGTYTIAKVGVAWVRYRVAARLHNGVATDGRYDNVEALSDGVVFDGQARQKGWFRSAFGIGDTTYATLENNDAPLPQLASSGGMTLETTGPNSFYVFPMHVTIDPNETKDQRIVCEVNVHESFRWKDEPSSGYAANVFDTTPTTYETVMSFGASAFSLFLEPK
jgi:hypothetical protein